MSDPIFSRIEKSKKFQRKPDASDEEVTNKDWSVHSEICSSKDSIVEDDYMSELLQQVDKGDRLKRRSTLVSNLGFTKVCTPTVPNVVINETMADEDTHKKQNYEVTTQDTYKKKNLLKSEANKRKLCMKHVRSEAFCFLNQLGEKLRQNFVLFMHMMQSRTQIKNTSLENHKIGDGSSEFSDEKGEGWWSPADKLLMSPIKTRKQINNPLLNTQQRNFLNVCTFYKSDDFVSFGNNSPQERRNSSATPIGRSQLISKNSINEIEEVKS